MATQVEIAKKCDLDVSSVCKILNRHPGAVFNPKTIRKVFEVAGQLQYPFHRGSKGSYKATLVSLFPKDVDNETLSSARGIRIEEVARIKRMLYGI